MAHAHLKAADFKYRLRPFGFTGLTWTWWLLTPSYVRLAAYRLLWRFSATLGGRTSSPFVRKLVPCNLYAKKGVFVTVQEALATQYVSENTSIHVPQVLDVLDLGPGKGNFLLLKGIKGMEYGPTGILLHNMSERQRAVFTETLKSWFEQLRRLPPPDDHTISGFLGTGLLSHRIKQDDWVGPFTSQDEFHAQDYCQPWEPYDEALLAALEKRAKTRYRICFTHGDISPHNILVDEQSQPCGLVDWECAGWMPEYWEYTRALYIRERYTAWKEVFTDIFPQYGPELMVERAIWAHYVP